MDKNKLKFRVWYKPLNMWVSSLNVNLCFNNFSSLSDVEINQYSGINDKNDKPIFDGDILKTKTGITTKVFFENGSFKVKYRKTEVSNVIQTLESFTDKYKVTVIGNIYENIDIIK